MARPENRRPPTDNEVIEYVATLIFILTLASIIANALTGCSTAIAY